VEFTHALLVDDLKGFHMEAYQLLGVFLLQLNFVNSSILNGDTAHLGMTCNLVQFDFLHLQISD
jgi:hypothetical protein